MTSIPPRFCPFCRECFEGTSECPDHELPLVDFDELPKDPNEVAVDGPLPILHLGHGRALIVASFAVTSAAFFLLPFGHVDLSVPFRAVDAANTKAPNLWATELGAVGSLVMAFRARTVTRLLAIRLVVMLLAALGLVSVGFTWWRIVAGARAAEVAVAPDWGSFVLVSGLLLLIGAGFRLGTDEGHDPSPQKLL